MSLRERFLSKVQRTESCWLWTGARKPKGYGNIKVNGVAKAAHRVAYELFKGPIPEGMHVLHTCDNPPCVNPDHLYAGTNADNQRDMRTKGRRLADKITYPIAQEIRARAALEQISQGALGREYGISQPMVSMIVNNKRWTHV